MKMRSKHQERKQILCTLGPSSLNDKTISRMEELGVTLFRINLSHTRSADVLKTIEYIQQRSQVPICLDTEGAQIRTASFSTPEIRVRENTTIFVHREPVEVNSRRINLYPIEIVDQLRAGDFVSIDFDSVLAQVITTCQEGALLRVLNSGRIGRNKAVTVDREITLPPLTKKDLAAI